MMMMMMSFLSYSEGSSVKSVEVDLSGFSFRLFSFVQLCNFERYGSKFL